MQNHWDGLIISGAPKEVLNANMTARLAAALPIPVATALRSSCAALKVFAAKRILLMTPVDDRLKALYCDILQISASKPSIRRRLLAAHTDAVKLTPKTLPISHVKLFESNS